MDSLLVAPLWTPWMGGGVAFALAVGFTPLVSRLARRRGWVDRPSDDRWHERPVALLGGIAIGGAIVGSVLLTGTAGVYRWPVWLGTGLVFAVGLADDLWEVRPNGKVFAQGLATMGLLYAGYAFWRGGPAWASVPLTFLWVIGVTNALNLIDSIDGLAAGVSAIAAGTLALMSGALGQGGLAVVMAAVAGGSLGFLVYNAPPASVFMGDCGSLMLGYLLAVGTLGVKGTGGPVVGTLVPVAVLAVPIADTTFVTITRLLRGQSVSEGGTDHVHHRLVRLGLSEGEAVLVLWGTSVLFGGLALAALWTEAPLVVAVLVLTLGTVGLVGVYLATPGDYTSPDAPRDLDAP